MIKQECIGIPDMILLLMIFCFKKIKIKAEIVLSPGGAYFQEKAPLLVTSWEQSKSTPRTRFKKFLTMQKDTNVELPSVVRCYMLLANSRGGV